jgi:chromosome segregation protein
VARDEESLLRQLADDRRDLLQRSSEKEGLEETLRRLEVLLDARRNETSTTDERIRKIEEAELSLVATITDDRKEHERLVQSIEKLSEENREKADLRDEKRDTEIRLSASLDALVEQIETFETMALENDHEKMEATVRLTSIDREFASQNETLDRIRRNLEENAIKREKTKIDHAKKELEYKALFEERDNVTARQQNLLDTYETANERVTTLFAAYEKHRSDMTRLKEQNDDILNRLWETHGLTKVEAESHVVEVDSIRQATIERNALKKDIDALGPINQNAVADYEALMARLNHMEEQREDIESAAEKLRIIVEELEQSMREQFSKTFHDINQNFSQVFSDLFSGGQAELMLEGDDDVLEAEIGIRAQPPGKKLQRLSLLSGGERCLTAIALIFAILKLKPTPFCLFDEVESALDDANVDRFAAYVRRYAWKMQFILITHRKGTMAAADRLYGITMQERGISRVLSMQLSSALSYGD